jgi:hypothetical protein
VALFEKVLSVWTPFCQKCIAPVFASGEVTVPADWNENTAKLAQQMLKKIVEAQSDIHGPTQIAVAQAVSQTGCSCA